MTPLFVLFDKSVTRNIMQVCARSRFYKYNIYGLHQPTFSRFAALTY